MSDLVNTLLTQVVKYEHRDMSLIGEIESLEGTKLV